MSKFTRISPKKIQPIAVEAKKLRINDAIDVLRFSKKKGATFILKVLRCALANAKNNFKLDKENLFIKDIKISSGPAFKRWRAIPRGIAHGYKRRTSHIKVILEEIKSLPKKGKNGS